MLCINHFIGRNILFKTILVDDNSSFRQLVKIHLQGQFPSMDVIEADDGVEALQKIDAHPPNLIFMDIELPGENGLELTKKIKAEYPDTFIIILTNHDSPEYQQAAVEYGADRFFVKIDFKWDEVEALVKSIPAGSE